MQEYGERWYEFPLLNAEAILALRQNNPEAAAECRQLALMLLEQSECRGWLSQERFSASEYS